MPLPRSRRRARAVSLVAVIALSGAAALPSSGASSSASASQSVSQSVSVSDGSTLPSPEALGTEVFDIFGVTGTRSDLVAAWVERGGRVMVSERPEGGVWQAPVERSEPGSRAGNSTVRIGTTSDGSVLLVWQADPDETGEDAIFARVRRPGGSWGAATQVSAPADPLRRMDLEIAGDQALLTWFGDDDEGTLTVFAADWTTATGWDAPERLSERAVESGFMTAALADDGSAVVAFETYPGPGSDSIIAATSRAGGGAWEGPQSLSRAGGESYDAQVAIDDGGGVHVLWVLYTDPAEVQYVAGLAGGEFKPVTTIAASPAAANDFRAPRLARAGDDLVSAWVTQGDDPSVNTLSTSVLSPGAADWTEPAELGAGLGDNDFGGFAVDHRGNVNAVWSAIGDGRVARYRPGRGWGDEKEVPLPSSGDTPQVSVDDRGRITVALVSDDEELLVSGPYVELPTATITRPRGALTTAAATRLTYRSTSTWSDLAGTRAQQRRTAWNKARPQAWRPIGGASAPAGSARVRTPGGFTHCLRVRAVDDLDNAGRYAQRCVTTPLDDRALKGTGWRSSRSKAAYGATLRSATRKGAVLTARGARARTVALLVRRSPRGGKVAVFQGKKRLRVVSLKGRSASQVVLPVSTSARVGAGTITIKVVSRGKPVEIDGLFVGK